MEKSVKISMLLEIYHNMLTERQADIVDLYYNQNLSLSEIGDELEISRQAVRKSLVEAEKNLLSLEEKLKILEKRLSERQISMHVSDAAIKWLGDNGYDAVFGARPLKRLITTAVEDKIADLILSGAIGEGSTVDVDVHGKELTVK